MRDNNVPEKNINKLRREFLMAKGAAYATAGAALYGAAQFPTVPFEDDLYNVHIGTIGSDDEVAELNTQELIDTEKLNAQDLNVLENIIETSDTPPSENQASESMSKDDGTDAQSSSDTIQSPLDGLNNSIENPTIVSTEQTENIALDELITPTEILATSAPDLTQPTSTPAALANDTTAQTTGVIDSLSNFATSSMQLASANPVTTATIVAAGVGGLAAGGYYLYKKYYAPEMVEEKPLDEQEQKSQDADTEMMIKK